MRIIVHLDADAFFASVEQAADTRLRGKAIAVGGERRGIIASASYEARRFGVFTPMPTARARKLCPRLIVLPGDYERYEQFSRWMFGYAYDFTPDVEQTSIDEGYFDLTANRRKPPVEIALTIRKAIQQSLKITVSEGLGSNKLISQIASKLRKPAAFEAVPNGGERQFLQPLPNRWLPGVGPKHSVRLNAAGLADIGQIAAMPVELLELLLGSQAPMLRQFANGIDERPLIPASGPQKSFSQQETFAEDATDEGYAEAVLRRMADHLFAKVREEGRSVRTLTVKVRYNDRDEGQCSESLLEPTDLETDVYGRLHGLLRQAWQRRVSLRMVSLKLSNVYDGLLRSELPLETAAKNHAAHERLAVVLDELRRNKGWSVVLRGHDLRLREKPETLTSPADKPLTLTLSHPMGEGTVVGPFQFSNAHSAGNDLQSSKEMCGKSPSPIGWERAGVRARSDGTATTPASASVVVRDGVHPPPHAGDYIALRVRSHYSFLDSTLSPAAIVGLAKQHGMAAIAMTDLGNLHGAVEFAQAAQKAGIKPVFGVELRVGEQPLLLYVESARGYCNLNRLLSRHAEATARDGDEAAVAAQERRPITLEQLNGDTGGLIAVSADVRVAEMFPGRFYRMAAKQSVEVTTAPLRKPLTLTLSPSDGEREKQCAPHDVKQSSASPTDWRRLSLSPSDGVSDFPIVACPPIHYALPSDRLQYDIIQSIRTLTLLREAHPEKRADGKFHFRIPAEMAEACKEHPEWLASSREIAERCKFEMPFGKPQFPAFAPPDGSSPREFLRERVRDGLQRRYGGRAAPPASAPPEGINNCLSHMRQTIVGYNSTPGGRPPSGRRNSGTPVQRPYKTLSHMRQSFAERSSGGRSLRKEQPPFPGPLLHSMEAREMQRASGVHSQIEQELRIISAVGYEEYFLVVWGLLQECRRHGIEWITRGSAADSLVCYCLGISDVCPVRFGLYFRRFLNEERMALNKLPDIDVDFPHDRKDDVVDLVFAQYGRDHCAVVGGFSTFQARSAFAEVAKVLGVAEREVRRFTEHFPWSFGGGWVPDERAPSGGARLRAMLEASPECADLPLNEEPFKTALDMAEFLDGVPRHPKMHPCGVVLSRQPMHELTPTFISNKGYPTTHFDMDAVEVIGLVKIDILAQGGLAVMRDAKQSLAARGVEADLERCIAVDTKSAREQVGKCAGGNGPLSTSLALHDRFADVLPLSHFPTFPPAAPDRLPTSAATEEPWNDPAVWNMISSGSARAVHHIESPAMTGLCRQCNVRDIDTLIAIVSVIRPGAANEGKKLAFTRRYQGLEPVTYPHPSLEPVLRDTFGLVVYEEHILQICEAFAGLNPGRADVLRRALNKQKRAVIAEIRDEFFASAKARGHTPEKTGEVWGLVTGFAGYAFCKAHSTAYGVEAYQAAWLKRYFPAEFMAGVLTNGKGFYDPLVYVLECHRLGLKCLPPTVNRPGPGFLVEGGPRPSTLDSRPPFIRVPLTRAKGLTGRTIERLLAERERSPFASLADFYHRVNPSPEELEILVRAGGFDEFGATRTRQFWEAQHLHRTFGGGGAREPGQGWLLPPPSLEKFPDVPLREPTRRERLEAEAELFGYAVSGHPLELFDDVAWDTYCPVARLGEHVGGTVVTCGLVVEQRTHHQITGEPMKFLTLADWTGMVETELFAQTYKSYGLATVRYPVLEVTATVEPFDNGRGFSLRVLRAGKPRTKLAMSQ